MEQQLAENGENIPKRKCLKMFRSYKIELQ